MQEYQRKDIRFCIGKAIENRREGNSENYRWWINHAREMAQLFKSMNALCERLGGVR